MKKISFLLIFFLVLLTILSPRGIQNLTGKISEGVLSYFKANSPAKYSIIRFECYADISDIELQRFYNLIITRLEKEKEGEFRDILTGFNKGKGSFNLNRINELDHYVTIKLINNRGNLGAGIVIYNRNTERMVSVNYYEETIKKPEIELLDMESPGNISGEYLKEYDLKIPNDLLDIVSLNVSEADILFFLFENKFEIYTIAPNRLIKINTTEIDWGRPYYPAIESEGNISLITIKNDVYVFAGTNFSEYSRIYKFENNILTFIDTIDFVVFNSIILNDNEYLAGFNFDFGKNFYTGDFFLKKISGEDFKSGEIFKKRMPPFYSAVVSEDSSDFNAVYFIDKNYKLRSFSGSEIDDLADVRMGYALGKTGDNLILSDYNSINDNIRIVKAGSDLNRPLYSGDIKGSIKRIKGDVIAEKNGFWMIIEDNTGTYTKKSLQFWRKNID